MSLGDVTPCARAWTGEKANERESKFLLLIVATSAAAAWRPAAANDGDGGDAQILVLLLKDVSGEREAGWPAKPIPCLAIAATAIPSSLSDTSRPNNEPYNFNGLNGNFTMSVKFPHTSSMLPQILCKRNYASDFQ
jgi:hypothetical protein